MRRVGGGRRRDVASGKEKEGEEADSFDEEEEFFNSRPFRKIACEEEKKTSEEWRQHQGESCLIFLIVVAFLARGLGTTTKTWVRDNTSFDGQNRVIGYPLLWV